MFLSAQPSESTLKLRPWGGTRLWQCRGEAHPLRGQPLGEAWEFSTLAGSESLCEGQTLRARLGHPLPFLAKLVDVARPLSVQVHPPGPGGKEEAWIVLDAEPDAYILAGLRPGTDVNDFEKAVAYAQAAQGRQDEVFECLQPHPVRKGSVVIIPPQTVHTIPCRAYIAEIQDPNDITYRFFDYGSDRPLHREQAFANLDPHASPQIWHPQEPLTRQRLCGQRAQLEVMGPGRHTLSWAQGERLLVAVEGKVQAQAGGESTVLDTGAMQLATRGPVTLDVESMAVVAWLGVQAA